MKRKHQEAGNTLISILVALGFASIIILTLASVFSDAFKNQRSITQSVAVEQEAALLRVTLSRPEICTQALLKDAAGVLIPTRTSAQVRAGVSFTEIRIPQISGGTVQLTRTYTDAECAQPANAGVCNSAVLSSVQLGPKRDKNGVDISQVTPDFMLGELALTYRKTGSVVGANIVTRVVPLGLTIDISTGKIISCQSTGDVAIAPTPTPTPPPRRCSAPIYPNKPWMKERIYCKMPNGQVSVLYYGGDNLNGAPNTVIYTSPHGNQPLTVRYNATTGAFQQFSGAAASDGGTCLNNSLPNISQDVENQCSP